MGFLIALVAIPIGLIGILCVAAAKFFCLVAPWPIANWLTKRMLVHAEKSGNWRAVDKLREAIRYGAPYVTHTVLSIDGKSYISWYDLTRNVANEASGCRLRVFELQVALLELTHMTIEEIEDYCKEKGMRTPWYHTL